MHLLAKFGVAWLTLAFARKHDGLTLSKLEQLQEKLQNQINIEEKDRYSDLGGVPVVDNDAPLHLYLPTRYSFKPVLRVFSKVVRIDDLIQVQFQTGFTGI